MSGKTTKLHRRFLRSAELVDSGRRASEVVPVQGLNRARAELDHRTRGTASARMRRELERRGRA